MDEATRKARETREQIMDYASANPGAHLIVRDGVAYDADGARVNPVPPAQIPPGLPAVFRSGRRCTP